MKDEQDSFGRSHQLSRQQIDDAVSPHELTAVLSAAGVKYVLIGGHILGYFTGSPRATVDVDVVVSNAQAVKASRAIQSSFPNLACEDLSNNIRFSSRSPSGGFDPERIDVVRAREALFQTILLKHSVPIHSRGQVIHIPSAEAAVALKFAAVISPNRGEDSRLQDRSDLAALIRHRTDLKTEVLLELGDLIYSGGGRELVDLVQAIREGKRVAL